MHLWFFMFSVGLVSSSESTKVLELSDRFLDVYKEGLWLVKFYAPWCGHCKKLEPIWNQVAQSLVKSPVRVGRVDCTRFAGVATEFSVKGFPTILFIKGDKTYTYKGDRVREEIVDFALRLSGPPIKALTSCGEIPLLRHKHSVFYLYMGEGENDLWSLYKSAADEFQETNFFYSASPDCLNQIPGVTLEDLPEVFVFKDDTSHRFRIPLDTPTKESLGQELGEWINRERFPLFIKITHGSFPQMIRTGKYIVMAVLEEDKAGRITTEMQKFRDLVNGVITNNQQRFQDHFLFGWVGHPGLANSVAMERLAVPSLIVVNAATYHHYIPDDDPKQMTQEAVSAFLEQILNQSARVYGGDTYFLRAYRMYFEATTSLMDMWHGNPVLTAVLFGLPLGFLSLICYSICCADILDATEEEDSSATQSDADIRHEKKE